MIQFICIIFESIYLPNKSYFRFIAIQLIAFHILIFNFKVFLWTSYTLQKIFGVVTNRLAAFAMKILLRILYIHVSNQRLGEYYTSNYEV